MPPRGFSWVDKPHVAALARPESPDDLAWLRAHGIQVLVSLTETPVPRGWVNDAGLMVVSVPIPDMAAPTERQLDRVLDAIAGANRAGLGVAVHCGAGLGRTGTILAAYLVRGGVAAKDAVAKVRDMRPGSIETAEQERAVETFARNGGKKDRG